jgi:cytochrome b6-f complex iron-sulfur subunit
MAQTYRPERTLTPRVHTRTGPEDTQGGIVEGASRRDFLRLTMLGTLGAILLGGVGGFLAFFWPRKTSPFGGKIQAGTLDDIVDNDVIRFRDGHFYLSRYKEPTTGQDVMQALHWKCAHLGCTVPWHPDESFGDNVGVFHCPCHGSIYLRTGQNVAGPAPHPLDNMAISFNGRNVVVDTGKISTRAQYEPSQATVIPG